MLGDRERAAVLVVFNAIFQVAAYALLGYFYLTLLPGWLGFDTQGFEVGIWKVADRSDLPRDTAGRRLPTRTIGVRRRGRDWYEGEFIPRIAPLTLYGPSSPSFSCCRHSGQEITSQPLDVARIAVRSSCTSRVHGSLASQQDAS